MKRFTGFQIQVETEDFITKALQDGYSPDVLINETHTPLIVAILYDRLSIFQILLKYGANPSIGDGYGTTPICYVIRYNPGFLFYILKSSPSLVNSSCFNNTTPLDVAMGYDYNCVLILLDAGAKIRKAITVIIPDYVTVLVQKRNRLKRKIILFLALSKKTKAVHKDLLSTISKMVWELRDTEEKEEESPSKKEFVKK